MFRRECADEVFVLLPWAVSCDPELGLALETAEPADRSVEPFALEVLADEQHHEPVFGGAMAAARHVTGVRPVREVSGIDADWNRLDGIVGDAIVPHQVVRNSF